MEKQLCDAAKEGDVEKVKELLSQEVGTEYRDEVTFSSVIVRIVVIVTIIIINIIIIIIHTIMINILHDV